ncbi:uncharacterized protein LOC125107919 [Lutra lutra]|uniref:uncharacterized protein LOC125107919 n=1 Tax=Lutra lutra TaxID=9657 RepID=UPI001FD322A4|nr:uncharacterized protein LOC125107919 [Lutra lutra]
MGGVSRSHEGLQLSLPRSEEAPHPASAPLGVPLQHFPCCLRTSPRPWLAGRSGLTLQGTLASACIFCDHLMGTGDKGAWNRGGQCALVVAYVPCSSGSPRRPGRLQVGFMDPPLEGESALQVAPPPRILCPQCGLDVLDCSQNPLALPSCVPQVQSKSSLPPLPGGIWGLREGQILVETDHVLAVSDGVSCQQCGGLVPCLSVATAVTGRDGALLPSAEVAEPGHWGASSPRLPVPPGSLCLQAWPSQPLSRGSGPLRQVAFSASAAPGAQACPCPRFQAGSSGLQASSSPGCTLRPSSWALRAAAGSAVGADDAGSGL